ncbi:MAG: NAD(+)/NADH kinase [Lachnospiraceae bacterium]|nr:NAD(+)/NADH kinase [Lachnospiraceae bacterium]
MKNFYIITNEKKDPGLVATKEIVEYISKMGGKCVIAETNKRQLTKDGGYTMKEQVPKDTEGILVLGGDGTLILAVRDLAELGLPFLGINFGNLGFLAEVEKGNVEASIDALLADKFIIEERMMVEGSVIRNGEVIANKTALNDIVFARTGGALRILDYKICLNGEPFNSYSGDGLIIATPTGSTAYNLSVGGPIVSPAAKLLILTPICPHTISSRSIVLPECDTIEVEVCKDRNGFDDSMQLFYDGGEAVMLKAGDRISVKAAKENTKIIRIKRISFIEQLRNKMGSN